MDAYLDTLPTDEADHEAWERDYKRTEAEFNALDTDVFYRQWMGATP